MVELDISLKIAPKTRVSVLPFFAESKKIALRKAFRGLSPAQKRAVRNSFKYGCVPKEGFFPVYSVDAAVLVYFLGEKKSFSRRDARDSGEKVGDISKKYELDEVTILQGILDDEFHRAFCEGVALGTYEFLEYKGAEAKKENNVRLKKIHFFGAPNPKELMRLISVTESVKLTKDMVNMPPMDGTTSYVERMARDIAKFSRKISLTVLGEKDLKKLGCGGILAVGQASLHESKLIILKYGGGKKEAPLALVGKGVTFDTGGLNIKVSQMRSMKQDLAGAATILGAFSAAVKTGIAKNLIAVIPTVENAINEKAYKPDDVITMYNGKTVEVTNTDAEGRLILADALAYAEKILKPRAMVDAATLTGSCFYAVDDDITAALSNDPNLVLALKKASDMTDEPIWELPLHQQYKERLKSNVADIVNHTKKIKAGTIEGGLFLQHFVSDETPWCHLDIASVGFDENHHAGTGRDVRLLLSFIENY